MAQFSASREQGHTDKEIILELIRDSKPDDLFSYTDIISALSKGLDKEADKTRVYAAIAAANPLFEKESKRHLEVVRGKGYRVVKAEEHRSFALRRRKKAENQIKRGINILQHVNMGELSSEQRRLHDGTMLLLSGVAMALEETTRRQDAQENILRNLSMRVDRLESPQP